MEINNNDNDKPKMETIKVQVTTMSLKEGMRAVAGNLKPRNTIEEESKQELRERATLVGELGATLWSKDIDYYSVTNLTKALIKKKAWTHFLTKAGDEVAFPETPEGFADFIKEPRPNGLGTTPEVVTRMIKDDKEALVAFDEALQRSHGGDRRSEDAKQHINLYNVQDDIKAPTGNSEQRAMRQLRKHRPDLLERVKAGEVSAHAATLEAGLRKPMVTVPISDIPRLAATLKRRLDANGRAELMRLLSEE